MKMEKSALQTVSSFDQRSPEVEVFIPELVEKCPEDMTKDKYRFQCPHAGQFMCKLTKLMFEIEGEVELLYRIVSWNSCPLDGLGQKEPAGPLYSINCHKGSIRNLHLPHCETRTDGVGLTVAHVTGGNMEIIQPLTVTNTHVVIDAQDLSLFGLMRKRLFPAHPIEAQVLLFYINLIGKHRKSKLHMHLLPGNVPIEEVKKHKCNTYIETSDTCELTPGKRYWPFLKNTDLEITIQPECEKFKHDSGLNYHPTFEIFFNTEVDEITLGLLDENKEQVWSRLVLLTEHLYKDITSSSHVEVFNPELVEKFAEDKTEDEYRFLCPRAGQFMCKLTKLMFEMEGEGEVLYRIVSWDSCPLDGLGQKEPAGPLYSINCHKGLIRNLHLPHCETRTDEMELTVAHVTGGNVEIIQPLTVTNTHVVIGVQDLSLFGPLIAWLFPAHPIEAQVLLFYKNLKGKHKKSKLHMHLLRGDVPIKEVKAYECNTYIETSATCELTPGKRYWPFFKNTDLEITIQPEFEKFKRDYSTNYHPTFEVLFNTEVDEITLGLRDENKEEVWSRLVLLTNTEAASPQLDTTGADYMDQHREMLIQKVRSVLEIADCLKSKNMISDEMYSNINVSSLTSQQQMRILYSVLDSGGKVVKDEAYKILRKKMPHIWS